ncbi:hypothetical protein H5410_064975 [Solanum commersonii]|uniref:Uncharacterized protein n=1 Tax=Solanum commersonii TaxID=4109 RepID=A0A9J5VXW7_SOLCO|nr:hypothetical protein H5410_064975 [Solanum commersonii]
MFESLKLLVGDNGREEKAAALVWNGLRSSDLKLTLCRRWETEGVVKSDCWLLFFGDGSVGGHQC